MNFLPESQIHSKLNNHRSIEQWLGNYKLQDTYIIRFVTLHNDPKEGFYCWYGDFEDVGNENYCDIYSLYSIDEENEYGNRVEFSNIEEMLDFCYNTLKASPDKFVGKGMLQDIYLEYLKTR